MQNVLATDQRGRLIVSRKGKVSVASMDDDGNLLERELLDLNGLAPRAFPAPEWARHW